ncbi:hypothetical protein [Vibrio vulnificus]|uniref:hypothetical protein n=1 Tax=Vibrio vulnificus TaxID=672 RepID=UPI000D3E7D28|nr:hypothetical protein [Vibrio vulnificus]MBN8141601.1 hypothetical protein [Vibrio vulnificus]MBN8150915.1 hypothetical protein [Vibrio vulnificus]NIG90216.1 hypothetical protein [Vibrio vulnificus]PUZ81499.1 hypothetical protein DC357_13760 [Vibrio vulnificus]
MELELIAGQRLPVTLDSEWLYVESAAGKITVFIESTGEEITLTPRSLYKYTGRRFGRIFLSGEGALSFLHGVGDFTPPIEGQQVQVSTMPSIELAPGQQVAVSELPPVKVQTLPPVTLDANQELAARILSLPAVTLDSNSRITVDIGSAIRISAAQILRVSEEAGERFTTSLVSTFPHTVAANANRKHILLKASKSNAAPVLVGAYELDAGESLTLASKADITMTGTAGDKVSLLELEV